MSNIVKITGKRRESLGTSSSRRLRAGGFVPCNVYGHKKETLSIAVDSDSLQGLIRSGSHVVDLDVEGTQEKALVREVQWNTFSTHIVHVDFLRVDVDERVKLEVPLHTKGTAPGVTAGGLMEIPHHMIEIECLAIQVPDFIQVRVGSLGIGDSIHVKDLQDIPEGVKILTAPEIILVHVVEPKVSVEEETEVEDETAAEPALVNPPKE